MAQGSGGAGDTPAFLILGATGGIGSELVRQLASKASLFLVARQAERLQALASPLAAAAWMAADATQLESVEQAVQAAVSRYGRLDGIANCVGSLLLKAAHQTSAAEWAATMTANLTSAFATVRSGAQAMMKSGGSIVLVSSAAARLGLANHEAIAAAKAGVIGLTLSAAATYARYRIRVNAVAPGLVRTPMTARLTGTEASLKLSEAMHALGRIGEPSDVASAIAWLLDPANSWITGQVVGVDGGLATLRGK